MFTFSEEAQGALDALATPVWVIDPIGPELLWANRSALALFGAQTLQELASREPLRAVSKFLLGELSRLAEGGRFESEFPIAQPGAERLVGCTFSALKGPSGRPRVLVEVHQEPARRTSLRGPDLEQRLQSRDRLASIGTIAAGIVHGINNPLSYVIANLEYVKRLLSKGIDRLAPSALSELGDVLDDSLDGADRVRRIVSDLGTLSDPFEGQDAVVDLERATERALNVAANEIRHRARVERHFSGIAAAVGSEAKLVQVILNVLINAAHSIEPGAVDRNVISVRTRSDERGRPTLLIEDTGCGIAKEHIGRVFDPFFTTKPLGVGTGLGLSLAHRIVRELEGEIQIQSVHGQGTRVSITLPAAPILPSIVPPIETVPPLSGDRIRARVLVIDDEPAILRAFRRVLFSHDVSLATSGLEALQKLSESPPFDVIFCDVMMPEMSGIEVYQRIAERFPGQEYRLIFMTGGAFAEPAAQFIAETSNPKLKKPFTGGTLRSLVASVTSLGRG